MTRSVLELTDTFMNDWSLPPDMWQQTKKVLGSQDFVDLISLVSQYVLFALNNGCILVQVETGVADLPGDRGPGGESPRTAWQ